MKIIILTGAELRHTYMRKAIALNENIEVVRTYCEGTEKDLRSTVDESDPEAEFQLRHIELRNHSEKDFFEHFVNQTPDHSNPVFIKKGEINNEEHVKDIIDLDVDLVVAYGCSLIKPKLIEHYNHKFLNVHLGLSPYYRGTGTNFWPLVNKEPQYVGATFMYIDAGVDTGEIIHQIRAKMYAEDDPHQVGNRLIAKIPQVYSDIINKFHKLHKMPKVDFPEEDGKYYRSRDFSVESVKHLYKNFKEGMIADYLNQQERLDKEAPIVKNPVVVE